jgi:hypothetical protein
MHQALNTRAHPPETKMTSWESTGRDRDFAVYRGAITKLSRFPDAPALNGTIGQKDTCGAPTLGHGGCVFDPDDFYRNGTTGSAARIYRAASEALPELTS